MRTVRTLVDSVAAVGIARATFLGAAKLDPACLQDVDARLPRRKLFELCELALEMTGDPAFGLHSIERLTADALNPIAALVVHSATLADAMACIQEFRRLLGDEPSFRLYEDAGKMVVRCTSFAGESLQVRRYVAEITLLGLFRLVRRFRSDAHIDCVAFEYGAPDYRQEYRRFFEGLARFEQSFTGLIFDCEVMAAAAPYADPELHEALHMFARRRVVHLTDRAPYSARVHDLLVWQRPPRDVTMASVARRLGVSVRSLRRHLTAEGKAYPDLVSEALASIAKSCLRDEQRTIVETATELGFADNTSFHRAFKRWTGQTPREYRRQHMLVAQE